MKAILRQVRISPKKANLVAGLVRNKEVGEALDILKFTPKKGADILYKLVSSAAANAENNFSQKRDNLVIKEIIVTKGMTYKRSIPISRGRVHPLLKRNAHITVKLEAKAGSPSTSKTAKKEEAKKESSEKTTKKEVAEKKTEKKASTKTKSTKKTSKKTTK